MSAVAVVFRQVIKLRRRLRIIVFKMQACFFKYLYQPFFVQETKRTLYVHRHVIPGGCLVGIFVPGGADFSMMAGKNAENIRVFFKGLVMVRLPHDVPRQK